MRLPFQSPFDWDAIAAILADRAIPGVESVRERTYRRTISLDGGPGVLEIRPGGNDHLLLQAHLPYWEGLIHVVERAGRMVGVDVDPSPAVTHLAGRPVDRRTLTGRPGFACRAPGGRSRWPSTPSSRSTAQCLKRGRDWARWSKHFGQPVAGLAHELTHLFPSAEVLTGADPAELAIDVPAASTEAIVSLARGVATGDIALDGSLRSTDLVARLTAIPGVGPSAAHHIALRLGQHDAFPEADPHLLRALATSTPRARRRRTPIPTMATLARVAATHLATQRSRNRGIDAGHCVKNVQRRIPRRSHPSKWK